MGRDDRSAGRYSGSPKPLMSLPTSAPARNASPATAARQVSTDTQMSKRSRMALTAGTTLSSSAASLTSSPGPALTPPTSTKSAPSAMTVSTRRRNLSKS